MEYGDDLRKLTSDYNGARKYELDADITIKRKNPSTWQKCKLLGTILDTGEDIKRRKILDINAENNLRHLFEIKDLTINLKMKINT